MRIRLCIAALGLSCLVSGLSGCGAGSGSAATTAQDFQGRYAGTFGGTVGGATDSGTLNGTVAADGTFTGTSHSNGANANATVTGAITHAGALTSTFVYPMGTYTASGTVSKNSLRHLVGTLTEFSGTAPIGTISIDLSPQ